MSVDMMARIRAGIGGARRRWQDERGVVLVLTAFLMVGLTGMVALSIDIGRIALARRQLQNATDAAVLAGVRELPDATKAKSTATSWATKNKATTSEIQTLAVSTTTTNNDTLTVTLKRTVPGTFSKVLGISSKTVTTTAKGRMWVVVGANTTASGIFPYAVWAGNKNGVADITPGKTVTYRSNDYRGINVQTTAPPCTKNYKNNCNWNIGSNTFKGFFHWHNGYVYLDPTTKQVQDQGGNAIGNEPVAELLAFQKAGTPIWLPMVSYAEDSSKDLFFKIPGFVCVKLDPFDTAGSADWTAVVLDPTKASGCSKSFGLTSGPGVAPTYMPQFTTKMIQ